MQAAPRVPITLGLVEDSVGFAQTLLQALADQPDIRCTHVCRTAAEAVRKLPVGPPDVVLLDMGLPDRSGVDVLRALAPRMPETDFVVLTVFDDDETINAAIQAGASGYLLKRSGSAQIAQAVRTVRTGGSPLDAAVSRRLIAILRQEPEEVANLPELTAQENRLLREFSRGASVKEASDAIGVTYATGRTYLRHIYSKLGVQSQVQAVRRFYNLRGGTAR